MWFSSKSQIVAFIWEAQRKDRMLRRLPLPNRGERLGAAVVTLILCAGAISGCVLVKWFWGAL